MQEHVRVGFRYGGTRRGRVSALGRVRRRVSMSTLDVRVELVESGIWEKGEVNLRGDSHPASTPESAYP